MADVILAHGAQPEPAAEPAPESAPTATRRRAPRVTAPAPEPAAEPAPATGADVAPPVVGFGFQFTIIDR